MDIEWKEERVWLFFRKRVCVSKLRWDEVARSIVGNGTVAQGLDIVAKASGKVACSSKGKHQSYR